MLRTIILGLLLCTVAAAAEEPFSHPYQQTIAAELRSLGFAPSRLMFAQSDPDRLWEETFERVVHKDHRMELVAVTKPPAGFAKVIEIVASPKADGGHWFTHFKLKPVTPLQKGEVIYFTAWTRSLVGGLDGKAIMTMNYNGAGSRTWAWAFAFPDHWERQHGYLVVGDDDPVINWMPSFNLDGNKLVQLGGLTAIVLPPGSDVTKLPKRIVSTAYAGREADAPWRAAAAARIEKVRKGDLAITVIDTTGKLVAGATVTVDMTRHAFLFGNEIALGMLPGTNLKAKPEHKDLGYALSSLADKERYQQEFVRLFNSGPLCCLWGIWEGWDMDPRIQRSDFLAGMDWLTAKGISIGGGTIYRSEPKRIRDLVVKKDREGLKVEMEKHFTAVQAVVGGRWRNWEFGNEWELSTWKYLYGAEIIPWWHQVMAKIAPNAQLTINDPAFTEEYFERVQTIQANGGRLASVQVQGHSGVGSPGPERWLQDLDRFAALKLPIEISEFDAALVNAADPAQRAWQYDYVRDIYTAVFSHPSTTTLTYWGFWESAIWLPKQSSRVYFYTKDWQQTEAGKAYEDLVLKAWWTHERATSSSTGTAVVRGFRGTYRITAEAGGRKGTATAVLGEHGEVVVKLE